MRGYPAISGAITRIYRLPGIITLIYIQHQISNLYKYEQFSNTLQGFINLLRFRETIGLVYSSGLQNLLLLSCLERVFEIQSPHRRRRNISETWI